MEPLIVIKGAKKIIRNKTILHLDRFTADAGDLVTVVEESGAGKSTLLNILGLNDQFRTILFVRSRDETINWKREALDKKKYHIFSFSRFWVD